MAGIVDFLTNELNLSHLFLLNNKNRELSSKGDITTGNVVEGSFVDTPICDGIYKSFKSVTKPGVETSQGFVIENTDDINAKKDAYKAFSVSMWFSSTNVTLPSCVYEQGGAANNMAICVGLAKSVTTQSAVRNQKFFISISNFLIKNNQKVHVVHNWEHKDYWGGSGNRITQIINGILQEYVVLDEDGVFPAHSGNIVVGNSSDSLKSYAESTQKYHSIEKTIGLLGIKSGDIITIPQAREIFERTVKAEHFIAADTVENQQIVLDSLSGNIFEDVNLAIRIEQATDATDYRLFVDNIKFIKNDNLGYISIQYVGPNTLTLENCNGSNVEIVSTPTEVELRQNRNKTNIIPGNGNIIIVEDVVRINENIVIENLNVNKIVFNLLGDFVLNNVNVNTIENIFPEEINLINKNVNINNLVGNIKIPQRIEVSDVEGIETKCIIWDNDNMDQPPIYSYNNALNHLCDVSGITQIRIAIDKPGYYSKITILDIDNSTFKEHKLLLLQSPNVDINIDISAITDATTTRIIPNAFGPNTHAIFEATINSNFGNITPDQWRRYHDFFTETEDGLTILGMFGLNGNEVYETTPSGVKILMPSMQLLPGNLETIIVGAFCDYTEAVKLVPQYIYNPRNSNNVKIETTVTEPLVDYNLFERIVGEKINLAIEKTSEEQTTQINNLFNVINQKIVDVNTTLIINNENNSLIDTELKQLNTEIKDLINNLDMDIDYIKIQEIVNNLIILKI